MLSELMAKKNVTRLKPPQQNLRLLRYLTKKESERKKDTVPTRRNPHTNNHIPILCNFNV